MRAMLLVALLVLAGCAAPAQETDAPVNPETPNSMLGPTTVVAAIDTGINVYHELFATKEILTDSQLAYFKDSEGNLPERVKLTMTGSYDDRVEADQDVWDELDQNQLYYFEGTRIFGYSFGSNVPVLDDNGASHGTAVAGSIINANPDAWVVMVEAGQGGPGEFWAAEQPFIDFLSESYGMPFSVPGAHLAFFDTHAGNREAYNNGKLPFGASDNSPALSPGDSTSGPPWVVAIAGDHPETQCRETNSGNVPDFTADWTQELPDAYSVDGLRTISGTSFSTPTSAGAASKVLLDIRTEWNYANHTTAEAMAISPDGQVLDNALLRDALNRTAIYFSSELGTTCGSGTPVNPAAPWTQVGWGHLGPDVVESATAHILGIEEASKPGAAVAYMEGQYEARKQAWQVS